MRKIRLSARQIARFRRAVRAHYRRNGRDFLWRRTRDPYKILVSEVMLQQTQTGRVAERYPEFLRAFPTPAVLARSSLGSVLRVWSGLGYNRRARYLRDAARVIEKQYGGRVPRDAGELEKLPGIGGATAAAVTVYAFNVPAVFIETNIRSIFIHHFFKNRRRVADAEILPLVGQVLDRKNPREWYGALMDYGVALKERHPNPSRRSRHYARQAPFKGSRRELRGAVVKLLVRRGSAGAPKLARSLRRPAREVALALAGLEREGMLRRAGKAFCIA